MFLGLENKSFIFIYWIKGEKLRFSVRVIGRFRWVGGFYSYFGGV